MKFNRTFGSRAHRASCVFITRPRPRRRVYPPSAFPPHPRPPRSRRSRPMNRPLRPRSPPHPPRRRIPLRRRRLHGPLFVIVLLAAAALVVVLVVLSVHEVVEEHVVEVRVVVHLVHQVLNLLVRHALAEHLPQRVPPFLPLTRTERLVLLRLSLLERRPVQRHVLTEPVPPALVHDVKDNLVTEPAQLAPGLPRAQHHRDNRFPEPGGEPRVARRLGVPQQPPHAVRDAADEEPIGPQRLAAPRRPVRVEQNTTSVI